MIPAPATNTGSETLRALNGVWVSTRPTPATVIRDTASEIVNSLTGSRARRVPTSASSATPLIGRQWATEPNALLCVVMW